MFTHYIYAASGTAVTSSDKGNENIQNKPPNVDSSSLSQAAVTISNKGNENIQNKPPNVDSSSLSQASQRWEAYFVCSRSLVTAVKPEAAYF